MNRIRKKFEELRKKGEKALIPYITGGYPSYESCKKIIEAMALAGADIVEIGIPFSDPLADGPTIQKASQIALSQGVTTQDIFNLVSDLRKSTDIPIVLMTYYNLFYRYGLEKFANEALKAEVDGVIIPDLPPEESSDWLKVSKNKLETIFLIAPTSTDDRIEKIVSLSQGFIYCVSLTGVTGARGSLPSDLGGFIQRVRLKTDKYLAVGFGVSEPEQAKLVASIADGVIIGSALIDLIDKNLSEEEQVKKVVKFIKKMKEVM